MWASTTRRATADQSHEAIEPIDTRVSIVVERCRRLRTAARWKGQPDQNTTGVARAPTTHSQPANRSAGIIEISIAGTDSTAATTNRRPRSAWRRASASSGVVTSASSRP